MAWQRRAKDVVQGGVGGSITYGGLVGDRAAEAAGAGERPRGQNHHAPLNAALIRSGSILAFAGYLLGHGTLRGLFWSPPHRVSLPAIASPLSQLEFDTAVAAKSVFSCAGVDRLKFTKSRRQ
jgi:hypothetical protein